jgi:hypothetical protein
MQPCQALFKNPPFSELSHRKAVGHPTSLLEKNYIKKGKDIIKKLTSQTLQMRL